MVFCLTCCRTDVGFKRQLLLPKEEEKISKYEYLN